MKTSDSTHYIILKPNVNNQARHLLISRPEWFEKGYQIHLGNKEYNVDMAHYTQINDQSLEKMILSEWKEANSLSDRRQNGQFSGMARYFQETVYVEPK